MLFSPAQKALAGSAFGYAERLAGRHFRMSPEAIKAYRYDIKTLAYLDKHEVNNRAFAHLCKYHYGTPDETSAEKGFHFYRICLQDNRILDAVNRAGSFIKLGPLLLYIAAHELVHVIRFENGHVNFDASPAEKQQEEQKVHEITQEMLHRQAAPELNLVMECFSSRYHIGDIFQ